MKFAAKASTDFAPVPAGNHVAICNAVIDLGMQPGRGMYPDPKHEVYVRFELPSEQVEYQKDGQTIKGPMSIGRTFTASMSEKANLRKFIEGWFAKKFAGDNAAADFDHKLLLGKKCLLNVTHTEKGGKVYANIAGAAPIPKGMPTDYPQHNESLFFSLEEPSDVMYQKLPEWLRKKIDERIEEQPTPAVQREAAMAGAGIDDDDVPF